MTSRSALEFIGITKDKIIQASLALIDETGLDAFKIDKIATLFHVKPASIHKYFGGMDEIQDSLTAGALAMLIDVHRDVNLDCRGREALEAYALVERAFAQAHPALYATALRAPRGPSAELRLLRQAYTSLSVRMLRGYEAPQDVAAEVANCLSAALQGFVNAELAGRGQSGPASDRNYERLLDMLDAGARAAGLGRAIQPLEFSARA